MTQLMHVIPLSLQIEERAIAKPKDLNYSRKSRCASEDIVVIQCNVDKKRFSEEESQQSAPAQNRTE